MKKDMKNRAFTYLVVGALFGAGVASVLAGPTPLPLRSESGTCIYHGGTTQTIETTFGTNQAALAFTGTTTYDFYSPPLAAPTSLTTGDRGAGLIFMANTSTTTANDFTVTGRMQYFDYDPATGADVLIVDTTASDSADVKHHKTVSWALPKVYLPANRTVPVGHLLHIALTISLVSGNPGSFGHLLYNDASGSTTIGLLPQNNGPVTWAFAPPGTTSICLEPQPDGCARLRCAGIPGQTYLIQAAASLTPPQWTTIATNNAGADGLFSFVVLDMANHPCRFYRTSNP